MVGVRWEGKHGWTVKQKLTIYRRWEEMQESPESISTFTTLVFLFLNPDLSLPGLDQASTYYSGPNSTCNKLYKDFFSFVFSELNSLLTSSRKPHVEEQERERMKAEELSEGWVREWGMREEDVKCFVCGWLVRYNTTEFTVQVEDVVSSGSMKQLCVCLPSEKRPISLQAFKDGTRKWKHVLWSIFGDLWK